VSELAEEDLKLDGRRERRELNRMSVLQALGELFSQGIYQPSSSDIAERAGISPRSLFRYFDDVQDLSSAAIQFQLDLAKPLLDLDIDFNESMTTKIHFLVEARVRLFEAISPAARAVRVCAPSNAVVARQLNEGRAYLREQVDRALGHASVTCDGSDLEAVNVMLSFESYELLRTTMSLSKKRCIYVLTEAVECLLAPCTQEKCTQEICVSR